MSSGTSNVDLELEKRTTITAGFETSSAAAARVCL